MSEELNFLDDLGMPEGAELLTIDEQKKSKQYTAEQVAKNERRRDGILAAIAAKIPQKMVAEWFAISDNTVRELISKHPEKVATNKKTLASKLLVFADLGTDQALQKIESMDKDKLLIQIGIAIEKAALLQGEATAILGHTTEAGSYDELQSRMEAIFAKVEEKQAAIPVESEEMGCRAEEVETNASDESGVSVDRVSTAQDSKSLDDKGLQE